MALQGIEESSAISVVYMNHKCRNHFIPPPTTNQSGETHTQPRILDEAVFGELKQLLGEGINEAIRSFNNQIESNLTSLEQAIAREDNAQIHVFLYSIAGSASNFGATRLVEATRRLEDQAKMDNPCSTAEALDNVHTESRRVLEYLKAYLSETRQSDSTTHPGGFD